MIEMILRRCIEWMPKPPQQRPRAYGTARGFGLEELISALPMLQGWAVNIGSLEWIVKGISADSPIRLLHRP